MDTQNLWGDGFDITTSNSSQNTSISDIDLDLSLDDTELNLDLSSNSQQMNIETQDVFSTEISSIDELGGTTLNIDNDIELKLYTIKFTDKHQISFILNDGNEDYTSLGIPKTEGYCMFALPFLHRIDIEKFSEVSDMLGDKVSFIEEKGTYRQIGKPTDIYYKFMLNLFLILLKLFLIQKNYQVGQNLKRR